MLRVLMVISQLKDLTWNLVGYIISDLSDYFLTPLCPLDLNLLGSAKIDLEGRPVVGTYIFVQRVYVGTRSEILRNAFLERVDCCIEF